MSGVIVDCALYEDGCRRTAGAREDPVAALKAARQEPGAYVWIGLHNPTPEELTGLAGAYGLHPLAVEDALTSHQRPKVEEYSDSLFTVLRTVRYRSEDETLEIGDLMVFVGDSFVITVRHGEGPGLSPLRAQLEARPEVLRNGPGAVLYGISDLVVDHHLEAADELEEDLEELEEEVFQTAAPNLAHRIYAFKRQVLKFRKAVAPLARPMDRLAGNSALAPLGDSTAARWVPDEIRPFFRDVADHVHRAAEHVDSIDRLLADILDANQAQIGVRQNDDMRKISAWAGLAAVPTMIAGIYGMNFRDMPELNWPFGYPAAIALMATVCVLLHRRFRKSGWL
ncbi:magnesium and cobalt transport protein CorA [Mangrovactinospora gilvigrisea]|uniref:Magnesium transport protein CorA n=1 Tax=Mangrovactinospora gilvigrisea TaxID=1428644 RepID=A0A1J7CA77_9ACTN|nr:magnesium/cobalt transporter CorA [Mangrovactinospora gilvigrisea]OIV38432.1 magnesium and cobalt transport protein CorA [Mangrovactinospora gilvigrisea]